jgi:hypothetical protein
VALSSLHSQQRAHRSGDADHGELHAVGKLKDSRRLCLLSLALLGMTKRGEANVMRE